MVRSQLILPGGSGTVVCRIYSSTFFFELDPYSLTRATIEVHNIFSNTTPHFKSLRHVLLDPKTDLENTKTADRMKNPMA